MSAIKPDGKDQSRLEKIVYWLSWIVLGPLFRAAWRWLRPRRVPIQLQLSNIECGAACLAMILSYHGRTTTVSESRERCGVSRDGASAQTLAKVARSYGLRVKAYSCNPAEFKYIQFPAIVHWDFNHFIVVERWTPKHVGIIDPASGRRRMTPKEFDDGFTGVVITFEPGEQFERRRSEGLKQSIWFRQLKNIARAPKILGMFVQVLIVSLLLQAFGLVIPIFTKVVVDQVLPFRIDNVMPVLGIGLMLIVLAQAVIQYLRAALLIYLQARLDMQLMLGFFEHVLTLPFRFFQTRNSGDLLMRLSSNAVIRELLTNQTVSVLLDGFFVLVYLVILFMQDISFGGIVLGISLLQVVLLINSTRRAHELMEKDLLAQSHAQGYLVEALIGIETLKISGAEERAFDHWSNLFSKQLNVSLQRNQLSALISVVMSALSTFSPLFLLWWGTMRVLDGAMSLGTMLALNALAAAFFAPLASLISNGQRFQMVGAHLDRIADVVKAEPEQNVGKIQEAGSLARRIEFKGVSFRYDPNAPWVLKNVSISIEVGKKVAVVGHTGSGKTTLGLLLLGLYEPSRGEILYDDIPLCNLNYRSLRNRYGVVLQQPFLFSGTIRQNIAFNDPNMAMEEVMDAARLAAIHDEIMQMPMGYETPVAEGGSAISGGQRQRIALARALARKPPLLLLDEATSDLDAITEQRVERNLSALSCTRLVIAHRLSTIRDADLILVLDQGEIVESGTHTELLDRDKYYATLVRGQLEASQNGFPGPTTVARNR